MNNIKYTISFLTLALLIPLGIVDTFAQSGPDEDDSADIGSVGAVSESTNIKLQELEEKYQNLKNIHYTINEEFNTTNSTKKIMELKSDYIQTINEFNALSYVEPERNYLAEWSALDAQVIILTDLQYDNYKESRQVIIDKLLAQMNEIEQDSIASMVLEPEDKKRLYDIETKLYNKYSNPSHETFVSNEFVKFEHVDHVQKKVYLVISESNTLAGNDISSISIAQKVIDAFGIDNVAIDFTEITPLTCISTTSNCDPLIAGISIGRADAPNDHSGTIGFRAKDNSNNVGFVTAGHVVQFRVSTNTVMNQPHTSTSAIGTIPSNGDDVCYTDGGVDIGERTRNGQSCDFAFVKTLSGTSINDDIYKSSRSTYDINALATSSDQVLGTMLKLVGSNSGLITGSLKSVNTNTGVLTMDIGRTLIGGDSGGPVFKSSAHARGVSTAEIFGIIIASDRNGIAYYEPTDKIMSELNLRPYN